MLLVFTLLLALKAPMVLAEPSTYILDGEDIHNHGGQYPTPRLSGPSKFITVTRPDRWYAGLPHRGDPLRHVEKSTIITKAIETATLAPRADSTLVPREIEGEEAGGLLSKREPTHQLEGMVPFTELEPVRTQLPARHGIHDEASSAPAKREPTAGVGNDHGFDTEHGLGTEDGVYEFEPPETRPGEEAEPARTSTPPSLWFTTETMAPQEKRTALPETESAVVPKNTGPIVVTVFIMGMPTVITFPTNGLSPTNALEARGEPSPPSMSTVHSQTYGTLPLLDYETPLALVIPETSSSVANETSSYTSTPKPPSFSIAYSQTSDGAPSAIYETSPSTTSGTTSVVFETPPANFTSPGPLSTLAPTAEPEYGIHSSADLPEKPPKSSWDVVSSWATPAKVTYTREVHTRTIPTMTYTKGLSPSEISSYESYRSSYTHQLDLNASLSHWAATQPPTAEVLVESTPTTLGTSTASSEYSTPPPATTGPMTKFFESESARIKSLLVDDITRDPILESAGKAYATQNVTENVAFNLVKLQRTATPQVGRHVDCTHWTDLHLTFPVETVTVYPSAVEVTKTVDCGGCKLVYIPGTPTIPGFTSAVFNSTVTAMTPTTSVILACSTTDGV